MDGQMHINIYISHIYIIITKNIHNYVCAFAHPSLNLKSPFFNHNGRGLLKILRRSLGISDLFYEASGNPTWHWVLQEKTDK
jgi:hypothetical protein